jgi:hypothetical protein
MDTGKSWHVALLIAATLSLAACDRRTDTPADVDAAAEKAKDTAVAAGHKAAELAEKARDNTKAYFESREFKQHAANAKAAVKDALDGPKAKPGDAKGTQGQ